MKCVSLFIIKFKENICVFFLLSAIDFASHEVRRHCLKRKRKRNWLTVIWCFGAFIIMKRVELKMLTITLLYPFVCLHFFFFTFTWMFILLDGIRALFYFIYFFHFSSRFRHVTHVCRAFKLSMPSICDNIDCCWSLLLLCHVKRKENNNNLFLHYVLLTYSNQAIPMS